MPDQFCCLCASDEGVFLDVTPDNRASFDNQFEACLTPKINETIELSSKICYKCAYELDQCAKFIQKCRRSHETSKLPNAKTSTPYCCLCYEYVENGHIFDITKDNRTIFNPLQKIRNIFNKDLTKKDDSSKLICLTCRYNLDVLYDLKKLYQGTVTNLKGLINGDINYSGFPKINTDVVNRKTTITTSPDITFYTVVSSDSDTSKDMARGKKRVRNRNATKSRNNAKPKVRVCDECSNTVANGNDMYRFHRTGLTVCKSCWITMDPSKGKVKRRSRNSSAKTKLCAVFLKDVLSEGSYQIEKAYKVKTDEDGNKLYVISDDSSQDECRSESISPKAENQIFGSSRGGRKRPINATRSDIESSMSSKIRKPNRSVKRASEKRSLRTLKALSDVEQPTINSSKRQEHNRRAAVSERSSDSDVSLFTLRELRSRKSDNRAKRNYSSVSDAEDANKRSRKKLRSILEGVTANLRSEVSDESSSSEDSTNKRKKNAFVTSAADTNRKETENKREARSRTRSLSSKETTPPAEFKSPKSIATSEVKTEYTCDKCNKKFDTKLLSMEHTLTHLKQAEVKLERINISTDEKQETEVDPEENETNNETKARSSSRSVSIDKHADDPSEEIAMNIEDDTDDDEEIFTLPKNRNAREAEQEKHEGNDSDVANKSDAVRGESCPEEEPMKIQNDDMVITEESRQCEDSTVVSDEIASVDAGEKDTKNEDTETPTDKNDTPKDKGDHAQESTAAIVEDDKDLDVEKGEDAEVKDTEVSVTEKEEPVSECNNDEEKQESNNDVETYDKETIESSVSTITKSNKDNTSKNNEDYSKSLENDLEDSCKDEENETTEDAEIKLRDSTNDYHKEDTKEVAEKNETTSNVSDKREILNIIRDLDDATVIDEDEVENTEKRQNDIGKRKVELEAAIDVDRSDNVEDNAKSNFSNCKKLDNAKDDDADEDDVAISIDNNDDIIIEKKSAANEEDHEHLYVESNTTNKKCETQENSKHASSDDSFANTSNEMLKGVFDLAAAEAQKREDNNSVKNLDDDIEMETLENISREIRNSADMPSLDPISVMDIDDDNDITLT